MQLPVTAITSVLHPKDFAQWYDMFIKKTGGTAGKISGSEARVLLQSSGLSNAALGRIWELSDRDQDGSLSIDEFCMVMALTQHLLRTHQPSPDAISASECKMLHEWLGSTLTKRRNGLREQQQQTVPLGLNQGSLHGQTQRSQPLNHPHLTAEQLSGPRTLDIPQQGGHQQLMGGTGGYQANVPLSESTQGLWTRSHIQHVGTFMQQPILQPLNQQDQYPRTHQKPTVWAITNAEKAEYSQLFHAWDSEKQLSLPQDLCLQLLATSGLPPNIVSHIFKLTDIEGKGRLVIDEFCVAMHLVYKKLAGVDLPSELPAELVPPAKRHLDDSVYSLKRQLMTQPPASSLNLQDGNLATRVRFPEVQTLDAGVEVGPVSDTTALSLRSSHSSQDMSIAADRNQLHRSRSPSSLKEGWDSSGEVDLAVGYISKNRRRVSPAPPESLASDEPPESDAVDEILSQRAALLTRIEELREQIRRANLGSESQLADEFFSSGTNNVFIRMLKDRYRKLRSLRMEVMNLLDQIQYDGSSGLSKEENAKLLAKAKEAADELVELKLELFVTQDQKRYKYPTLAPSAWRKYIPGGRAPAEPETAGPGTTDIQSKAAQLLLSRMAALTGGQSASSLTTDQRDACRRIEEESKRLKSDIYGSAGLSVDGQTVAFYDAEEAFDPSRARTQLAEIWKQDFEKFLEGCSDGLKRVWRRIVDVVEREEPKSQRETAPGVKKDEKNTAHDGSKHSKTAARIGEVAGPENVVVGPHTTQEIFRLPLKKVEAQAHGFPPSWADAPRQTSHDVTMKPAKGRRDLPAPTPKKPPPPPPPSKKPIKEPSHRGQVHPSPGGRSSASSIPPMPLPSTLTHSSYTVPVNAVEHTSPPKGSMPRATMHEAAASTHADADAPSLSTAQTSAKCSLPSAAHLVALNTAQATAYSISGSPAPGHIVTSEPPSVQRSVSPTSDPDATSNPFRGAVREQGNSLSSSLGKNPFGNSVAAPSATTATPSTNPFGSPLGKDRPSSMDWLGTLSSTAHTEKDRRSSDDSPAETTDETDSQANLRGDMISPSPPPPPSGPLIPPAPPAPSVPQAPPQPPKLPGLGGPSTSSVPDPSARSDLLSAIRSFKSSGRTLCKVGDPDSKRDKRVASAASGDSESASFGKKRSSNAQVGGSLGAALAAAVKGRRQHISRDTDSSDSEIDSPRSGPAKTSSRDESTKLDSEGSDSSEWAQESPLRTGSSNPFAAAQAQEDVHHTEGTGEGITTTKDPRSVEHVPLQQGQAAEAEEAATDISSREPAVPTTGAFFALYDFSPQTEEELRLEQGDRLTMLELVDEHWMRVRNMAGIEGLVPVLYVEESPGAQPVAMTASIQQCSDKITVQRGYESRPESSLSSPNSTTAISQFSDNSQESSNERTKSGQAREVLHNILDITGHSWSSCVGRNVLSSIDATERKRQESIFELVATEQSHYKTLATIQSVFQEPLSEILSAEENRLLFSNLGHLVRISQDFLEDLLHLEYDNEYIVKSIWPVLAAHLPELSQYKRFIANQKRAMILLQDKMMSDSALQTFLRSAALGPSSGGLSLSAHLLVPMQRVTRYQLLVKNIVKYTSASHPDHAKLTRQVRCFEQLAKDSNDLAADQESSQKLRELANRFTGLGFDLESETRFMGKRKFVLMGSLVKAKSGRKLEGLLCNDVFVLRDQKDGTVYRGTPIPLHEADFTSGMPDPLGATPVTKSAPGDGFEINGIRLKADSVSEAKNWRNNLVTSIQLCLEAEISYDRRLRGLEVTARELSVGDTNRGTTMFVNLELLGMQGPSARSRTTYLVCEVERKQTKTMNHAPGDRMWNEHMSMPLRTLDAELSIKCFAVNVFKPDDVLGAATMKMDLLEYYGGKWTENITLKLGDHEKLLLRLQLKSI